ncbi:hypothetical protein PHYC_01528 [Phycisphaerales bacterium]|nr:hypothetical protein PHYC_01528 [Phycisphaerales bacterium]
MIDRVVFALTAAALASAAGGQVGVQPPEPDAPARFETPFFVVNEPARPATLASGAPIMLECQSIWKPVCGTPAGKVAAQDLAGMSTSHAAEFAPGAPIRIVDTPALPGPYQPRTNINIVYVLGASVPAAAVPAFAAAEQYIEAQFTDPITVTVSVSFANLGPGVLGGTGSTYGYVTYANSRAGLVAGMDADDTIQSFLPTGTTVPVRYKGSNSRVTNENRVFWTIANFNATAGSAAGNAASMQYSNTFPFDYDPSNGVSGSAYSFQDVVIHETGHALGFTSGADFRNSDLELLDLFRFQRTDGTGDYNPDTTAEFQVRPRLVSYNSPNDDHNSDLISVEYRMSDGSPNQASHFRDQTPPIGIMDPTLGYGQTFYPNFFLSSDLTMFDAIGYDR